MTSGVVYMDLKAEGFIHFSVNHSRNFVDPADRSVHTQSIESMWSRLKAFLRRQGLRNRVHLEEYIAEFMLLETTLDAFKSILDALKVTVDKRNMIG